MKISALTTCVGEKYARYLNNSLRIWLETCDEVVVVTDLATRRNAGVNWIYWDRAICVTTDVFTAYGASFNKGAALSEGFAAIKDPEWILNFDADVLPPANWRELVEPRLSVGKLHGCSHRYREDGSQIPDADYPNIWGFFHLWNVADPHTWKRPVFESDCGHAGNYDHTFMTQWPETERVDLWPDLKLIHQGEPRQSWFGNDPKNDKKMANLFMLGLWDAWHTKAGHIKTPSPDATIIVNGHDLTLEEAQLLLKEHTDPDPFKYKLEIKCPPTVAVASTK